MKGQVDFFPNILTGQKQDLTKEKFIWPLIMSGHCPKIILSPEIQNKNSKQKFKTKIQTWLWGFRE